MSKIKPFAFFLLKVLLAMIVINGILSLLGGGVVANFITNPVGTVKGFFASSSTPPSSAAAPAQ